MSSLLINDSNISELFNLKDDKYSDLTSINIEDVNLDSNIVFDSKTLKNIEIFSCKLKNLDFSKCPSLSQFRLLVSSCENLDLTSCTNLETFYSRLSEIPIKVNLSNCPKLSHVQCNDDNIIDLNVVGCSNLTTLQYKTSKKNIQYIDLAGCCNLENLSIYCDSINLQDCVKLKFIEGYVGKNTDLSFLPNLKEYKAPLFRKI